MVFKQWWSSGTKQEEQIKFLSEQKPIILMGRGHSGTRVLSWACSRLGIMLGTREGLATGDVDDQTFTQSIKKIAVNNVGVLSKDDLSSSDLRKFQNAVFCYHKQLGSPKRNWGWKFPETYLIAPYLAATFPGARYLHLIRDGRDIAFKKHLTDDIKRKLGRRILTASKALDYPHHVQAALSWAFQVDYFDQFRHSVAPEQIVDIRFEDLCTSPYETVTRLCEFLEMPFTDSCKTYLEEQIDTDRVAQYKTQERELVKEVEHHIRTTLERYHYLDAAVSA